MEYNFREIEKKWHEYWIANKVYKVEKNADKPKYYVLDMFPYPSGAGLHVGHPLGYIASDIYSRYKRLQGFNVLHPMGYDAYGLPAEQYAIQTGQHPEVTTKKNIARYREQMDKIGFSYDWNREIRTCDPEYYKWTQWAFIQMFNSYYCNDKKQARPISELVAAFEQSGTEGLNVACSEELHFTAGEWKAKNDKEKQEILLNYRIAYRGETMVNWCAALGTVLANDEVVNGVSERGGYPVEQKIMRQWCLRVSAYAQRLLDGLETIDWTDSLKETQRNWIGRSEGAEIQFKVKDSDLEFTIFTTRADTMFGVTFMVLAPESELVAQLTTPEQKQEVDAYLDRTKKRTERERIADRSVTGVFSGSYAINPFTRRRRACLDQRLCTGRLRNRCHHGCSGTRQPRLCICQTFQLADCPADRRLRRKQRKFRCQRRNRLQLTETGRNASLRPVVERPDRKRSNRRHQEIRGRT